MVTKSDILLMVKVAEMHYVKDMDQDEIAGILDIPSELVCMALCKALEHGIVEVKIKSFA